MTPATPMQGRLSSATLSPLEIAWRNRQEYLESCGYLLRPRYRPGWQPSWEMDPSIDPYAAEDFAIMHVRIKSFARGAQIFMFTGVET